jgi:L,D-transpeptidase YcbB
MRTFVAGLLTAFVFVALPSTVHAQEIVRVNGVEATRIVIAPPRNDIARTIKVGLAEAYYSAKPGSRDYTDAQKLYFFYGARHFDPLWLTEGAGGKTDFSANAAKIIDLFKTSYLDGLEPKAYLTDDIDLGRTGADPVDMARLETAFSAAVMRYAQDIYGGRVDPRSVSSSITLVPNRLDESETLVALASAEDPVKILNDFAPKHREYGALKLALAKFYDGTAEQPVVIPDGKTLKLGMRDERVPLLRQRLKLPAVEDDIEVYDAELETSIEAFQDELGLMVDGVAGPATIAALNGGSATSKEDIIANMDSWRWMPRDLGKFHVFVNVPEFRLYVEDGPEIVHTTRVVVGKPHHMTPIFSDEIEHVVVNPYWNVPRSIASDEIAPILASNPGYIARNNMELLSGGRVVDAASVDWATTNVNNFRIRQRPGSGNALGSVKFLFPNQHNVYLHDTPSKSLFNRSYRAFSHGCVRVHNPWEFAAALLQGETKVSLASLESQRGGGEQWNNLDRHVPVHIAYFTLRVDPDGTIRSFGDVYGHNKKHRQLLGL